jgi:hypothetical protein
MARETIEIQLTPEERTLLMRCGYPFAQIEHALKACEASHDIEFVPMDCFELERLIGDVCRSINQLTGGARRISFWISANGWKRPKNTETARWTCSEHKLLPVAGCVSQTDA